MMSQGIKREISMKEVWAFIETRNGKLDSTATKMAAEAKRDSKIFGAIPCGVSFGLFPSSLSALKQLRTYGIEKIYVLEEEGPTHPDVIVESLCSLVLKRDPEAILFAGTASGSEIAAKLAAKLGKGFVSYCVDFEFREGRLVARKPVFGGKAHAYFAWKGEPPYIATVDLHSLEAIEADKSVDPELVREKPVKTKENTKFLRRWQVPLSDLKMEEARIVVGIGGGLENKEFMKSVDQLADLLGAVVGGSRVAVFKGYIPVAKQIGATGNFIDSDIYMPIAISGSSRHTVAIKNVKHVIPININKEAPIFKFAGLGVVGDLYKVVPAMIEYVTKLGGLGSADESSNLFESRS